MIKAIIFDIGSVCFNMDWKKVNEEMIKKFGISTLIRSNYGEDVNMIYDKAIRGEISLKELFQKISKDRDVEEIINFYKKLCKENNEKDEEVMNLAEKLKSKFKIAFLTDTNDIHFQAHEEQKNFDNFTHVFTSFKLGKMKKDKDAFEDVIRELNVEPNETVLVDDSDKNIENARAYGLKAIKYENYEQLVNGLNELGVEI